MPLTLSLLKSRLVVLRFAPSTTPPTWVFQQAFYNVTRTAEELSIVCDQDAYSSTKETMKGDGEVAKEEADWACLKVEGPLDFGLTGVLSSLAQPLAVAKISIFAMSTFDTDYILVKSSKLSESIGVLRKEGFTVNE